MQLNFLRGLLILDTEMQVTSAMYNTTSKNNNKRLQTRLLCN